MQRFHSLVLSTVLLLGISPAQDRRDGHEPRAVLPKAARLANKKTLAEMQGAWRLVDMKLVAHDAVGMGDVQLDHVGFCLISGGYMSIELHIRLLTQGEADRGRSLVTGLHRIELDEGGSMETTTVIATKTDSHGTPEFEPPGTTRHYEISLNGESMTLTRDDGHTLVFERLIDDRSRFDVFGNQVMEKEDADEDEGDGEKKDGDKKEDKDEGDEDG